MQGMPLSAYDIFSGRLGPPHVMVSSASKKETFLKSNHAHGAEKSIQPLERPLGLRKTLRLGRNLYCFTNFAASCEESILFYEFYLFRIFTMIERK